MRDVQPRAVGISMAITGIILWTIAVAVDAPTVAVILPIIIVMVGALLMVRAGEH